MKGITVYINGIAYWFENPLYLMNLLDSNCNDSKFDTENKLSIEYDK